MVVVRQFIDALMLALTAPLSQPWPAKQMPNQYFSILCAEFWFRLCCNGEWWADLTCPL